MDLQSDSLHLESLPLRPTYDELVQLVILEACVEMNKFSQSMALVVEHEV